MVMKALRAAPAVPKAAKAAKKKKKQAQMDLANRALCHAHRNPGPGKKKTPYSELRKLVKKIDGFPPSVGAMAKAAKTFKTPKAARGRKQGWRKTSKKEDRNIMKVFKKLRPPGCGIDSRELHQHLTKKLQKKIKRRTVIRRLREKGFTAQKKQQKSDPGPALMERRVKFARKYEDYTSEDWKRELQGVGDFKDFTHYPGSLYPKFKRLRARWTYMTKAEKKLPAFQRPKRWFPKKEYKKTTKVKVFGLTTSNGKLLAFACPSTMNATVWAALVKKYVGPFLRRSLPSKRSYQLILDGEKFMHAPEAKAVYTELGITVLPQWPANSPELNPQENVWSRAEPKLRQLEGDGGHEVDDFKKLVIEAVLAYSSPMKLVPSMANRIKECIDTKGAMIDY